MSGRMVRCENAPCVNRARLLNASPDKTWRCGSVSCPVLPRDPRAVGQPKQKGGKRK